MTLEQAAAGFAAIGSAPRLEVIKLLVRAGPCGLTVGNIQSRVKQPPSTLAHHLRFLAESGLVEQEKIGRSVVNRACFDQIAALASYLTNECCLDASNPEQKC